MKKIIMILALVACSLSVDAQNINITSPPAEKTLVATQTWVVKSGKTSFRIITSDDTIAKGIMQEFEDKDLTRFTYSKKKDRSGEYWERSFYFKNESWDKVAKFVNTKCR